MTDIEKLRQWSLDGDFYAIQELIDRIEAAESARRDDYQNWMTALDRNAELLAKLEAAEKELAELRSSMKFRTSLIGRTEAERDELRAKIEQMEKQKPFAWIVRGGYPVPLDKLEWQLWYGSEKPTLSWVNQETRPIYALPGAQDVPKEAIAKILTEVMNIAVANGADSRSMPDEYVEVAAWLCGVPGAEMAVKEPTTDDHWRRAVMEIDDSGFGAAIKHIISERAAMLAETARSTPDAS